jgi:transposase
MNQPTQFLGIDLHKAKAVIAVLPGGAGACESIVELPNEDAPLRRFFKRVAKRGPIRACYEASGCGYVLQRRLKAWGHECEVIAPSLAPTRPGDRVKTDRRDAERLAFDFRAGLLTPVHLPTEAEERVRGLVRSRDRLRREVHASKQYLLKFLDRQGLAHPGKNWTQAHRRWLAGLEFEAEDAFVFRSHLALLELKESLLGEADRRIEQIAQTDAYRERVGRLRCFRGVDTTTAMTLLAELIDVRRFGNPRALMDYVGLTISEYSSGARSRRGGITKAGNGHVRRILIEAAWHCRHRPNVGVILRRRQRGQDPAVIAHAWRAQRRLYGRFHKLSARMLRTKAVTAVARELVGFLWAVLQDDPRHLHPAKAA